MLEISTITSCLCGILFITVVIIFKLFSQTYKYWEKRNVPYLNPIVPFGDILKVFTGEWTLGEAFGEIYLEFKRRGLKHGGMYVINKPVYIPVDRNIIKNIMISDAENFPNHGLYINLEDDPLSSHIFNMEGKRWKDLRSKLPQAFTSAKMRQMFTMMVNFADELKNQLDLCQAVNTKGINIKNELRKFTTDVISTCGYGLESNALKGENEDLIRHLASFFDYQWNLYKNAMVFVFPRNVLKSINFRIFTKDTTSYVKNMFLRLKEFRKKGNIQRDDLANTILKLTEDNSNLKDYSGKHVMESLTDDEYCAQMWVFFSASFETSSSTLTFALFELAKNPECQKKLRSEISNVLAQHRNQITYDSVMEMKYLECVIDGK